MPTRENSILNLLKRAVFYASDGAAQINDIVFSKEDEQFLIEHFDIYYDYAATEAKSQEESAHHATDKMALYLHENLLPLDSISFNKWTEFLRKWNKFLYTDCTKPNYLTGLSEAEAQLVLNNTLSKEEQYDLYQFVLFKNPSTAALQEEIRNRVSAKATGAAGLMSSTATGTQSQYRDPNTLQVTLSLL